MKFFTDLWAFLTRRNENAWFYYICNEVSDEDRSNSVKDHSGRSKATIIVSAIMQVERRLSAWAGGRDEANQASGNSFSCSYTYACFTWEYWFMLLPEGLPQETCVGGIIWGEVLHGISVDKLWEQISRSGLVLPAPLRAGDIQDVPGKSESVMIWKRIPFSPYLLMHMVWLSNLSQES